MKKRGLNILVFLECIILAVLCVLGFFYKNMSEASAETSNTSFVVDDTDDNAIIMDPMAATSGEEEADEETIVEETDASDGTEDEAANIPRNSDFSQEVLDFADGMSDAQKAAQLILVSPELVTEISPVTSYEDGIEEAIDEYPIGGLVFSNNNFEGNEQFHELLGKTNNYYTEITNTNLWFLAEFDNGSSKDLVAQNTFSIENLDAAQLGNNDEVSSNFELDLVSEYTGGDIYSNKPCIYVTTTEAAEAAVSQGFSGVIIGMDADPVELLNAGCDMVYITEDLHRHYNNILSAINAGALSTDRLDDALYRVLTKKESLADTGLSPITIEFQ